MTWNMDVVVGTAPATVRFFRHLETVQAINVSVAEITRVSSRVLSFALKFTEPLASYDITLDAGLVRSVAASAPSNAYADHDAWQVQVMGDVVPPHLVSISVNDTTGAVTLLFDEPIRMTSGSSITMDPHNGRDNITISSENVVIDGNRAIFSAMTQEQDVRTRYTVGFADGTFVDGAGNAAASGSRVLRLGNKLYKHDDHVALIVGLVLGLFFLLCALCFLLYWYCLHNPVRSASLPVSSIFFKSPTMTDWIKVRPDRKVTPLDLTTDYTDYSVISGNSA
eukprot:TRINITY_DN2562_c0_g1_i9.p1 TRINITY_DN2562_c0_g1~~TRINITY_DN2562_c0_g1_i9.p1  ORF type:complete len:281 (-),score=63.36 TRINITY_DN2562_c0_g1_i9:49-891(-)